MSVLPRRNMICAIVGWPTSTNGVQRARPDRVEVAPAHALGEVHVAPGRLDVPEQLVQADLLVVGDGGLHVPVAERAAGGRLHGHGVAVVLDEDLAGRDGVDGRAVGRRDVDAEVERVARVLDARVVEERAHGVLAVERLERPGIRGGHGRPPAWALTPPSMAPQQGRKWGSHTMPARATR